MDALLGLLGVPAVARSANDIPLPPSLTRDPIIPPAAAVAELPPSSPTTTTETDAPFSIQTIGVDKPDGTSAKAADGAANEDSDWVVVTMTPSSDAAPTSAPHGSEPPPEADAEGGGECRLLGPFALFVQLGLGTLAILSLVYKRWRERPQRPVKIWFFDASKQVFGSVLVHMSNVFLSLLTSGRFSIKLNPSVVAAAGARLLRRDDGEAPYVPNPCSSYLLNLAIDTTVGIPILILLLRIATALVSHTPLGQPPESIQSGNYGHPPNAWWWLKQSILYFCGLFGMKTCVLIIFLALPWISHVGDWALSWTAGNEQIQIIFVMMLFPLIMNCLQYYIIDSFIKKPTPQENAHHAHHHAHHHHDRAVLYEHLSDNSADDEDSSDESIGGGYSRSRSSNRSRSRRGSAARVHSRGSGSGSGSSSGEEEELEDVLVKTQAADADSTRTAQTSTPTKPEYDPEVDGDSPTTIGSSSSRQSRQPATAASAEALSKALHE